jgi:hypothetical protein
MIPVSRHGNRLLETSACVRGLRTGARKQHVERAVVSQKARSGAPVAPARPLRRLARRGVIGVTQVSTDKS